MYRGEVLAMQVKGYVKKLYRPLVKPIVWLIYIRVFNRHLFANMYTRKLPVIGKGLLYVDGWMLIAHSRQDREGDYKKWLKQSYPTSKLLKQQRKDSQSMTVRPKLSVLVPTYNTKPKHLRACIDSVLAQSYEYWELCIADDASSDREVSKIIKEYARKDSRVKYIIRKDNGHISRASNSALKLASGEYIALLDHDDVLWPNALYEVAKLINKHPDARLLYSDEDKIDEEGVKHSAPFFKPNWSFEFLRSINYITHFAVLERSLVNKVGGFRVGYEGAQDWDLFLRISRQTDSIYHIPTVLYSWRMTESSTASQPSAKDYAYTNQRKALEDDIKSRGLKASLSWQIPFSMWRVDYKLPNEPTVSIIIPTKDQYEVVKQCLRSIAEKTTYKNFDVVITDTGSSDERVWELYKEYQKILNLKVVEWKKPFNFSSACNFGADHASGDFYLFLNNDTEVISPDWIESMVGYASQEHVGAVGCRLYYPDGRLQHGGIILGVGGQNGTPGIAGHFFPAFRENPPQDPAQLLYEGGTRNFSAVTAACVMVEKKKFDQAKGFDPKFKIAFNDVDFCLKLLSSGYRNVYLPHVQLFHHESISVGRPDDKRRDLDVFSEEISLMLKKWPELIADDPYYHPCFRRDIASARLEI